MPEAPYHIAPDARVALVGVAPDMHDVRSGEAFGGRIGRILGDAMAEAGLTRRNTHLLYVSRVRPPKDTFAFLKRDVISSEVTRLRSTLKKLKPDVIVALGAEAAHALVPDWPDARSRSEGLIHRGDIKRATDIENRRGYVFETSFGPVVASVDPRFVDVSWSPWRALLSFDLQRAVEVSRNGLVRPTREVEIIRSSRDAVRAAQSLRRQRVLASDIETWRDTSLACIGFAGESGKAYVFPAEHLDRASELLRDPDLTLIWANGIYDLFVLKHRYNLELKARIEDVQVMWHAAYPELAGAKEDKRKHRFTRKSLSFLASLSTYDGWWKGDYETKEEFFIYNGKDCCITFDVEKFTRGEMERVGAQDVYEHERGLIMPCVDMLARGLRVDEDLRKERVRLLEADLAAASEAVSQEVAPWLEEKRDILEEKGVVHLFEETEKTCECCGHGKKKQAACWACVGFKSAPSKKEMERVFGRFTGTKKEMEEKFLPACRVCEGKPRETRMTVNLNSNHQMKALLFDVLKLPKRASTDEATLKDLLAKVEG